MNVSLPTQTDAAHVAADVRQLAKHAHRVLADPCPSRSEIRELSQSLANLRRQLRNRPTDSVTRWLDRLEQKVSHALLETSNV